MGNSRHEANRVWRSEASRRLEPSNAVIAATALFSDGGTACGGALRRRHFPQRNVILTGSCSSRCPFVAGDRGWVVRTGVEAHHIEGLESGTRIPALGERPAGQNSAEQCSKKERARKSHRHDGTPFCVSLRLKAVSIVLCRKVRRQSGSVSHFQLHMIVSATAAGRTKR